MIYKLRDHKYSQCHVVFYSDASFDFISYNTIVISGELVQGCNYKLKCSGLYSATTRRQIGWFLKEYFSNISYYDIKRIAGSEDTIIARRTY